MPNVDVSTMPDKNFGQKSNLRYHIAITKHVTVVQTDFEQCRLKILNKVKFDFISQSQQTYQHCCNQQRGMFRPTCCLLYNSIKTVFHSKKVKTICSYIAKMLAELRIVV